MIEISTRKSEVWTSNPKRKDCISRMAKKSSEKYSGFNLDTAQINQESTVCLS